MPSPQSSRFSANPTADLEAVYSFPVPEDAAVSEFTYRTTESRSPARSREETGARGLRTGNVGRRGRDRAGRLPDIRRPSGRSGGQDVRAAVYLQPGNRTPGSDVRLPLEDGGGPAEAGFWTANERSPAGSASTWLRSAYPVEAVRLPSHPQAVATRTPTATGDLPGQWCVGGTAPRPRILRPVRSRGDRRAGRVIRRGAIAWTGHRGWAPARGPGSVGWSRIGRR